MTSYGPGPKFYNKIYNNNYDQGFGGYEGTMIRVSMTQEEYDIFLDWQDYGDGDLRQMKKMAKEIQRLCQEAHANETEAMTAKDKLKQEKNRSKKLRKELKEARAQIDDLKSKLDRWEAAIEVAEKLDAPEGESSRAARLRARHAGEVFSGMVKK
jgi:predicted nuclease with TOPRIM domain